LLRNRRGAENGVLRLEEDGLPLTGEYGLVPSAPGKEGCKQGKETLRRILADRGARERSLPNEGEEKVIPTLEAAGVVVAPHRGIGRVAKLIDQALDVAVLLQAYLTAQVVIGSDTL
jgi:hypothetical protein